MRIKNSKAIKVIINLLVAACAILLIALAIHMRGAEVQDQPVLFGSAFSLLPPLVAIILAVVTKEVYSSLFVGIVVGAMLYSSGNPELALNTMLFHEEGGLVAGITDSSHAGVLVIVIMLATMTTLLTRSGSAEAFGKWADKHIKTRIGAQLATFVMGLLIFVDDGFNCLTVGSVMRPLTDRYSVSRAKLAYIIDSTAAPVCIIAPISCWAAAVSYAVPEGMDINGFRMFIRTIPYNLYALVTLLMLFLVIVTKTDFGPMKRHEANALKGDLISGDEEEYAEEKNAGKKAEGKLSNLIIPVAVLIIACILGMAYTGGLFEGASLIDSFANADSARGLLMGSLIGLLVTLWLYMNRKVMPFKTFMESFAAGFRSMCAPMIILILSWNLSGMTGLLGAADFIHGVVESSAAEMQMFVPFVVFVVSVFLAFSTGTSWGTFTILIPIVCAVFPADSEMLVISIAACLSGAVCGDHCSPISDTTIMSSAGSHCNHLNHVTTQIPYALTAAGVSAAGYLIAGIIGFKAESAVALIATPVSFVILAGVIMIMRKAAGKAKAA